MAGWEEQSSAMKMRDVMERIATRIVNTLRPEPKLGEVYSFDEALRSCEVLFPGDTQTVRVQVGQFQAPQSTILNDGKGDVVRVAGRSGIYYLLTNLGVTEDDGEEEGTGGGITITPVAIVEHGADANVARPSAIIVHWVGTADPANALDTDFWTPVNL